MSDIGGMMAPELQILPQISDRMTFIYLERCKLNREDSAIVVRDENGVRYYAGGRPLTSRASLLLKQAELVSNQRGHLDVADLYKAEIVIPLAFEVAAENPDDLPAVMRRKTRDAMVSAHLLERMVKDEQLNC